jgi:hypothetical protein
MDRIERCEMCKKKLPIKAFPCKCNKKFCNIHKPAEEHKCSFNYFEEYQKNIKCVVFTKKETCLAESI